MIAIFSRRIHAILYFDIDNLFIVKLSIYQRFYVLIKNLCKLNSPDI